MRRLFAGFALAVAVGLPMCQRSQPQPQGEQEGPALSIPTASQAYADRQAHLGRMGVLDWHRLGRKGKNVKIAILDTGWRGYAHYQGKALPLQITSRSFRTDRQLEARDSQHGILCAEVIHAIAPEAQLIVANWEPDSPIQFLQAAQWARDQGASIITCSVIMPCWSDGEGGGPIHAALSAILGPGSSAQDRMFFACAGNLAQRHWSGSFRPDAKGFHTWAEGHADNTVTAWEDESLSVELSWPGDADYEVQVFEQNSGREVGRASSQADIAKFCAVLRFQPYPQAKYRVRVRQLRGQPGPFHLAVLGGWLEHHSAAGSIPFPGDGPAVVTVGAVDPERKRADYSSCGPNSPHPKPDFVAGVPFPSAWRNRAFTGTSAAAPQAAAFAALIWSEHPEWSPTQVRRALQKAALDLGPPGHDAETGYGLIRLPREGQ